MPRLSAAALSSVPGHVTRPAYDRRARGVGIVHMGIGAFHRAHQALYTDNAMAAQPGDWMIAGVSLRSPAVANALNPQNGLYSLTIKAPGGDVHRIGGAVAGVLCGPDNPVAVMAKLTDPMTRIVSLTVTEKGYYRDSATGGVLADDADIRRDLDNPQSPRTPLGYLAEALALRRATGTPPFTVLSCDNLPDNGNSLARVLTEYARLRNPGLADWIAERVAFPSTMVDRIVPATTEGDRAAAARALAMEDQAAVVSEPFTQWVIEENFSMGRPYWEAGGAIFVGDVRPYEHMKLRMLNGAHSLIAYAGHLAGHAYVRDAMADPALARLVHRHFGAAAASLDALDGIDLDQYAESLAARFANPAIAHETYQIAMDGTEKLPQRIFEPAVQALARGQDIRPFAFAAATWMRYTLGRTDDGQTFALRDPRETEIATAVRGAGERAADMTQALMALPSFFPAELTNNDGWTATVDELLSKMLSKGMVYTLHEEAGV